MIDSDLSDFPVLINITDDDLKNNADSTGYDIVFTGVDTSWNTGSYYDIYPYEIEKWDSSTGELICWVKPGSISSTVNTSFYMYYGSICLVDKQNPAGVWDDGFVARFSMADETTSSIADSTSNSNDGSKKAADEPVQATGKIGYAQSFDGSSDFIKIDDSQQLRLTKFTLSGWFAAEVGTDDLQTIINRQTGTSSRNFVLWVDDNSGFFTDKSLVARVGDGTKTIFTLEASDKEYLDSKWYYFTFIVDNSTKEASLYINGELKDSNNTWDEAVWIDEANVSIGTENLASRFFKGILDEIRISNIVRSAAWINASYNTMNSPALFLVFGAQEVPNVPPAVSSPNPADESNGQGLNPSLSVQVNDNNNDLMDVTFRTNASGIWTDIETNRSVSNGTYSQTPSNMDSYLTRYYWSVNVTDGQDWTNRTFSFTTRGEYIPDAPGDFTAITHNNTQVNLSWVKVTHGEYVIIERNSSAGEGPWSQGSATEIYNNTGVSFNDMDLTPGVTYYYQAWSYNEADKRYSTSYASANNTTSI
jgi:hypothetical protein